MAQQESTGPEVERTGDRRAEDRRRTDRRAPTPMWRRPWALVAYGVLGALVLVFVAGGIADDEEELPERMVTVPAPAPPTAPPSPEASAAPPVEAFGTAAFERLVIEGEAAQGKRVRTVLYCDAPAPVALRERPPRVEGAVAALADGGRVPAAACKWGARGDARRQDFLLLIPPALADEFAAAPVATDDFVRRRRIRAEVEWIGRSEALHLRTAGVLRRVLTS